MSAPNDFVVKSGDQNYAVRVPSVLTYEELDKLVGQGKKLLSEAREAKRKTLEQSLNQTVARAHELGFIVNAQEPTMGGPCMVADISDLVVKER